MPISTGSAAPVNSASLASNDIPESAVTLLEWPDRAGGRLPPDPPRYRLHLVPGASGERPPCAVTGYGKFAPRAERIATHPQFSPTMPASARRTRWRIQGDASTRSTNGMLRDGRG